MQPKAEQCSTRMGDRGRRDSPRKTCYGSPLLWLHCQVSHNPSSMQHDEAEQRSNPHQTSTVKCVSPSLYSLIHFYNDPFMLYTHTHKPTSYLAEINLLPSYRSLGGILPYALMWQKHSQHTKRYKGEYHKTIHLWLVGSYLSTCVAGTVIQDVLAM